MKIKFYKPKEVVIHVTEGNITIPQRLMYEVEIDDAEIGEIIKQIVEVLGSGGWR